MHKALKIFSIIFLALVILLLIVLCFLFVGRAKTQSKINWGVDFSQMQAESLGLNWKQMYSEMIDGLGVKNIKIHTQWDWIEGEKGNYYFDDVDWQLNQAKLNGVKIIYVVGMKSGRWPECHIPDWAKNLSEQEQKDVTLSYIKTVVERYKNNSAISYWQVENEPLFKFGECPGWYYKDDSFLKQEVAFVKSLDPFRKIIVSDSGEMSSWFDAAKIGDIVGTTMYRGAWAHISNNLGFYYHYLFSPVFYSRKALLIKKIFGKDVICVEFQAEPWASKPFNDVPLTEQNKTMNLQIFKDNVKYVKATGFDTVYFWGVEWWYWLKTTQNQPAIWNEAKILFSN